jgi:hypothetical protein
MRLIAIGLLMTGCLIDHPGGSNDDDGVVGSRDDMATRAGDYGGYRVATSCEGTWSDVGVIGTGSVALTQTADISAAGKQLETQLADLTSVWGWGGYGLACEPGVGTQVHLSNWRDVDTVIGRVGAWLHTNDYSLQVAISVSGIPVPHATE